MNEFRFICSRLILDERVLKILSVTERHSGETPFDRQRAVSLLQEATHFLQQYSSHPTRSTNQSVRRDSQHFNLNKFRFKSNCSTVNISRHLKTETQWSFIREECYRISKPFLRPIRQDRVLPQVQVSRHHSLRKRNGNGARATCIISVRLGRTSSSVWPIRVRMSHRIKQ